MWEIGIGSAIVLLHIIVFYYIRNFEPQLVDGYGDSFSWTLLFRSIFFILGFVSIAAGLWGLYQSKHLSLDDIIPTQEAVEFIGQTEFLTPYYSYALVGAIVLVGVVQVVVGLDESFTRAAFVKQDFIGKAEYWRILTGATLHGSFLHLYLNGQALYGIGASTERVSNRAHLSNVFLLAVLGGGLCSFVFMRNGLPSVGASGGIMGLIGYLAVFGQRRKHQLPPGFSKNLLVGIALTALMGVIGFQFIDNFAHLGGLIVGAAYAFIQIPSDKYADPRQVSNLVQIAGLVSLGIYLATCVFSILLIMRTV